jgi:Fe-S-cluster containining protein
VSSELPIVENCNGCGLCCLHMSVPPFGPNETDRLPKSVYDDFAAVCNTHDSAVIVHGVNKSPCGWLDLVTRKCRHYDHRPEVCRDFDLGGHSCVAYLRANNFTEYFR